ncbi:MAG: hypothetical protein KBF88_07125 [Polyangiaceae bacterium]|nr:hypothetical protein [Polyangiaceae bacterium]
MFFLPRKSQHGRFVLGAVLLSCRSPSLGPNSELLYVADIPESSSRDGGADAEPDAGSLKEPPIPQGNCERETRCEVEDVVVWNSPPPFEHCPPTLGKKPTLLFSPKLTVLERAVTPKQCCYVSYVCGAKEPLRPIPKGFRK